MAGTLRASIACFFLTIGVIGAQAAQMEKITPDYADSAVLPGAHGQGPAPIGPINDPNTAPNFASVPEPSTIAMMFLGSGCLGALTALRRRRRD